MLWLYCSHLESVFRVNNVKAFCTYIKEIFKRHKYQGSASNDSNEQYDLIIAKI